MDGKGHQGELMGVGNILCLNLDAGYPDLFTSRHIIWALFCIYVILQGKLKYNHK